MVEGEGGSRSSKPPVALERARWPALLVSVSASSDLGGDWEGKGRDGDEG
jgi:hypothetical protein